MTDVRIERASPEHVGGLVALFRRSHAPCHCRYWHFSGDTNAWLARCAHEEDVNAAELSTSLIAGSPDMSGVVAVREGHVVGWTKIAPAEVLSKVYDQRIYRRLPCFDGSRDGVYAVSCMLIDPDARGTGLAGRLLAGAIAVARSQGARAIEAFPRRGECLREDELGAGPHSVFVAAGFECVHDFAPYPVLRLVL